MSLVKAFTTVSDVEEREYPQHRSYPKAISFKELPGWDTFDAGKALKNFESLFHSACFFHHHSQTRRRGQWHVDKAVNAYRDCFDAFKRDSSFPDFDIKKWLRTYFQPYEYRANSLGTTQSSETFFTGYYHPVLKASKTSTGDFKVPLYSRPEDLIVLEDLGVFRSDLAGIRLAGTIKGKTLCPFYTRREINRGVLAGRNLEIGWVQNPLDAFLMMVQGSGTLMYTDGTQKTFHYDGTNGHAYTSIGKELIAQGVIPSNECSLGAIRLWCESASQDQMMTLLEKNESYVFFQESQAPLGPEGAIERPLVPLQSVAVDPNFIPMGTPLWLDIFSKPGSLMSYQGIGVAQDIGGAIKGPCRADFYCGPGQEGEQKAGTLAQNGHLFLFLPQKLLPQDIL